MTTLQELIDAESSFLRTEEETDLDDQSTPDKELDSDNEDVPAALLIQAVMEQLAKVKDHERTLLTKQLFFERILSSDTVEDTIPSHSEFVKMDLLLGAEKKKLRSIKAARAQAEKDLASAASELDTATVQKEQARAELEDAVRSAKATANLELVKQTIAAGNESDFKNLISNIDTCDSEACSLILEELSLQRAQLEKEAMAADRDGTALKAEAGALEKEVSELKSSTKALQEKISGGDNEESGLAGLRHECAMQEQLGDMLHVLTGVRVSEVREHGMTFQLNARAFSLPQESPTPESLKTHTLEIEVCTNDVGETIVAFMHLDPPDVNVSDLREDLDMSLYDGVGKVCERLRIKLLNLGNEVPETP